MTASDDDSANFLLRLLIAEAEGEPIPNDMKKIYDFIIVKRKDVMKNTARIFVDEMSTLCDRSNAFIGCLQFFQTTIQK